MLKGLIKIIVSVLFPALLGFLIMLIGAIIINKLNVGEGTVPLFSVIATAVVSIMHSYLVSKFCKIKNIYCMGIAVLAIAMLKVLITIICGYEIVFSLSNMIDMLFIVLFSFVGTLLSSITKK